jgi:dTMP kinase
MEWAGLPRPRWTLNLFYATDFADRIEKQIIPALRAGMVCITDRYIYSMIARAVVRGVDEEWIKTTLSFALVPDVVFYLRAETQDLLPRVLNAGGFDYWESGMDFLPLDDPYEAWMEYQTRSTCAAGYRNCWWRCGPLGWERRWSERGTAPEGR